MPATIHRLPVREPGRAVAPRPGDDAQPALVRDWLRQAMERGDDRGPFTPTRLAEAAGVAHSTLTRALDPEAGSAPTLRTLNRVARVTGLPLPDPASPWVPVVSAAMWRRFGPEMARSAPVGRQPAVPGVSDGCLGVVVSAPSIAGVEPGDVVLVRPGEPAAPGEPVAVALPDGTLAVGRHCRGEDPPVGAKLLGPVAELRRELAH